MATPSWLDDLEESRLSGVRQVRAAAELDGRFRRGVLRPLGADQQHAHRVGVLLAEDGRTPGIFFASASGIVTGFTGRSL